VLKQALIGVGLSFNFQPPSGGCVLKPVQSFAETAKVGDQPPSGGCVLKPVCL